MTIKIKCANCPTTVQRVPGTDDDAVAPWLCPDCDTDDGQIAVQDAGFGSEQQLKDAIEFYGEQPDVAYVRHVKAEGLFDGQFPDEPQPERTPVDRGEWFPDDSVGGRPSRAQGKKVEQRLAKYGLAENQLRSQQDVQAVVKPILEGSDFQGGIQGHQFDRRLDRKSWHSDARRRASGSDLNEYHAVTTREHKRLIPAWTLNDGQVQEALTKLFPRHATDARQRAMAGRWLRIVYLYFRVHHWVKTIAGVVGCSARAVESVISRARRTGEEMFGSASSAIGSYGDADVVILQPPIRELKAA